MSFNDSCREYSGVTRRAANSLLHSKEPMRDIFFQPYRLSKPYNPFFRAATLVTAPICCSIIALEMAVAAVVYLGKSILSLTIVDFGEPWDNLKQSGNYLYSMCLNLLAAAISPVVNLVDLVGGGVTTAACRPCFD